MRGHNTKSEKQRNAQNHLLNKLLEKDVQRSILDYLLMRGHVAWKTGGGLFRSSYKGRERFIRMGVKGVSDIIVGQKGTGRLCAIEVKLPGEKPTEEQVKFLESINACGGLGFIAFSVDDVVARGL